MRPFREQEGKWVRQVETLAASGFYADEAAATRFAAEHVYRAWRAFNDVDRVEEVVGKKGLRGAEVLVVHLFARGVLGVGDAGEEVPRLVSWRPSRVRGTGGDPVCHRVIATADIARIIHRSEWAVRRALRWFKGLDGARPKRGTWNVISLPTGVALDGMLSTATRHPYMYAGHEYADARAYADACKRGHKRFTKRQFAWCEGAMTASGLPVKRVSAGKRKTAVAAECF